ncbi:MAG: hypothetical protein CMN07_12005 [Roseobacter sp.]|nr:hypothetical protein [Roseobacter sp.]|tara:strand:- start:185 stop:652 length:468 start_codon:yes stop_codon:yes gene_type:complete
MPTSHPTHRSIPQKIAIVAAVMGSVAGTLTGIMTWANTGFSEIFLPNWGISFLKAVFVLLPFAFLLMGLFDKLLSRIMPGLAPMKLRIVLGLIMAVIMQSLMAVITAGTEAGFGDMTVVRELWLNAFITAFPVGLALALVLTTTVRPWLLAMLRA